ncbi:MAG: hypothetical protein PHP45_08925 [Elusimicrobiales bacterium]|nr:hypothetical protein [Elusimicrobiales bacterium]
MAKSAAGCRNGVFCVRRFQRSFLVPGFAFVSVRRVLQDAVLSAFSGGAAVCPIGRGGFYAGRLRAAMRVRHTRGAYRGARTAARLCAFRYRRIRAFFIFCGPLCGMWRYGAIGNRIATEALSYSVLLLTLAALVAAWQSPSRRNLLFLCALAAGNTLIRPHAVFAWAGVAALGLLLLLAKKNARAALFTAVFAVCAMLGAGIFIRSYNYVRHGVFAGSPIGSRCVLSNIVYACKPERDVFPEHSLDSQKLKSIYGYLDTEKLSGKYCGQFARPYAGYYSSTDNLIIWKYIPLGFGCRYSCNQPREALACAAFTERAVKRLLRPCWRAYAVLAAANYMTASTRGTCWRCWRWARLLSPAQVPLSCFYALRSSAWRE